MRTSRCWTRVEALDIQTLAEIGVDGIGIDNCALPFTGPAPSADHSVVEYRRFHDAWLAANASMNFQVWDGGFGKPSSWAPALGHIWRTGPDCGNRWDVRSYCRSYFAAAPALFSPLLVLF